MDKPEYSPYPYEKEHLLMEGLMVSVVGIEENVRIENDTYELKGEYNGQTVNIVYLYTL